tara:strand:+ start:26998 stop:27222 length:225 start_codon:yes stop_codon:yes gene_type:complete
MSIVEEKVFGNNDLRLYILKFIVEPICCIKCGVKKENYYKFSHAFPKFCLWCAPKTNQWRIEVLRYNRAVCLNN